MFFQRASKEFSKALRRLVKGLPNPFKELQKAFKDF
jgi:hypothetical protein